MANPSPMPPALVVLKGRKSPFQPGVAARVVLQMQLIVRSLWAAEPDGIIGLRRIQVRSSSSSSAGGRVSVSEGATLLNNAQVGRVSAAAPINSPAVSPTAAGCQRLVIVFCGGLYPLAQVMVVSPPRCACRSIFSSGPQQRMPGVRFAQLIRHPQWRIAASG